MTAAPIEWPSLDKILADATPVEPVPFDFAPILDWIASSNTTHAEFEYTERQIARYVNSLRLDTARAQNAAVALEQENAHLTARITEALGLLGDALLWCNDAYSNTADSISEAIAALRGTE